MNKVQATVIPDRAYTLMILRVMDRREPMLMLIGDDDGFGTRWTLHGQQVEPAIARYLMDEGFIAEFGKTEFGARKLALTEAGTAFFRDGDRWWKKLKWLQRLWVRVFG